MVSWNRFLQALYANGHVRVFLVQSARMARKYRLTQNLRCLLGEQGSDPSLKMRQLTLDLKLVA